MDEAANPFDDDRLSFLVLRAESGDLSLWPEFKSVPSGWRVVFGPATRAESLAHVAETWAGPALAVPA